MIEEKVKLMKIIPIHSEFYTFLFVLVLMIDWLPPIVETPCPNNLTDRDLSIFSFKNIKAKVMILLQNIKITQYVVVSDGD